jgi:hypothetical protein
MMKMKQLMNSPSKKAVVDHPLLHNGGDEKQIEDVLHDRYAYPFSFSSLLYASYVDNVNDGVCFLRHVVKMNEFPSRRLRGELQCVVDLFIRPNSPLEINISGRLRNQCLRTINKVIRKKDVTHIDMQRCLHAPFEAVRKLLLSFFVKFLSSHHQKTTSIGPVRRHHRSHSCNE